MIFLASLCLTVLLICFRLVNPSFFFFLPFALFSGIFKSIPVAAFISFNNCGSCQSGTANASKTKKN